MSVLLVLRYLVKHLLEVILKASNFILDKKDWHIDAKYTSFGLSLITGVRHNLEHFLAELHFFFQSLSINYWEGKPPVSN